MVVANTNDNKKSKDNPDEKAIGKEQMEWIKKDIKKAREWSKLGSVKLTQTNVL